MNRDILVVKGMTCSACSNTVEKYISKQKGVIQATVNLALGTLNITYDNTISLDDIIKFIKKSGYEYGGKFDPNKDINIYKRTYKNLIIFGILLIFTIYISMSNMFNLPNLINNIKINNIIIFILSIIFIIYGFDILKIGFKSLIIKDPNMDSLVFIGVLSNFIYSLINLIIFLFNNKMTNIYFESICTIIYFVKLGEFIENKANDKTKDAIKEMVMITPSNAHIIKNNKIEEISIDNIKKDDILCANVGERVAVDGIVIKGESHINNSFITGESYPVKVKKNSKILAGSINLDNYIEYKATDIGPKSMISEIIHMVIDSSNNKTNIEKKADKYSNYFTKLVIIISILTFIIYLLLTHNLNTSLTHFISVLIVSCPCALGLATPLALMISNNISLKNKILLRNYNPLEISKDINEILFDKTGTLTEGKIKIDKINNYSNKKDNEIIEIISSIEHLSNHPLSKIFSNYKYGKVNNYKSYSNGITGEIDNKKYYIGNYNFISKYINDIKDKDASFYLASDNKLLSSIYVSDKLRKESKSLIKELKNNKIKTIMLTGDNEKVANEIGKELEINEIHSSLIPIDKINFIKKEKENKIVMMVGDGINDAPSLKEANIGVSLSNSTSIATSSADVILLNNNLNGILKLINISKKTSKIIKENLIWAFFYNFLMIPIACGLTRINLSPSISSIMMCISSLTVVLNSLRLRK